MHLQKEQCANSAVLISPSSSHLSILLSQLKMVSVGDIVRISGLSSSRGMLLNGNYAKVSTPLNTGGRCGVKPFTELVGPLRKMVSVPVGDISEVLLKELNITALPVDNPESEHMRCYSASLDEKCMRASLQDRLGMGTGASEHRRYLEELYSLAGRRMRPSFLLGLADAERKDSNYERALTILVDLYHSHVHPYVYKIDVPCLIAFTLLDLNRPHAASSFINACTRPAYDARNVFDLRKNIAERLKYDPCGEDAYKKLVQLSPENPVVLLHFGEYYARKGDLENAIRTFEQANACPGLNRDQGLKNHIQRAIDVTHALYRNGTSSTLLREFTCTRDQEESFDINA